jgi:hypothetical protein
MKLNHIKNQIQILGKKSAALKERNSNQYPTSPRDIATTNRFDLQQQPDIMHQEHDSTPSLPKPKPIFVHGV